MTSKRLIVMNIEEQTQDQINWDPNKCLLINWFSVVGSVFVVLGLYSVLWGKGKEEEQKGRSREEAKEGKEDLECQMNGKQNYIKS